MRSGSSTPEEVKARGRTFPSTAKFGGSRRDGHNTGGATQLEKRRCARVTGLPDADASRAEHLLELDGKQNSLRRSTLPSVPTLCPRSLRWLEGPGFCASPRSFDSGRFSALNEDLSDADLDEGGGEAPSLPANVDESSNLGRVPSEVIAMSDAEGPTVGCREVAPAVMDLPSVVRTSGSSHRIAQPHQTAKAIVEVQP